MKKLKRTTASFAHILGKDKKELFDIIGGILTKEIKSKKCFNDIKTTSDLSIILSLNCGIKIINGETIETQEKESVLAFFLLKFIKKLRGLGSVPALEADKYLASIKIKGKYVSN